jgi:N-acetylneuraminic acid mutarotase
VAVHVIIVRMRFCLLGLALALASLSACSLPRTALGNPGMDASVDASHEDAFRLDVGVDASDAQLPDVGLADTGSPDMGLPDMGIDAFVVVPDGGSDGGHDGGSDGGACALCTATQLCCSFTCVDTMTDPNHCGSCSPCPAAMNATAASCAIGACHVATCAMGFRDCNTTYSDGCEIAIGTTTNCLSCGDACMTLPNTISSCAASGCAYTCASGYASCNAASPDCETHTDIDPLNCGACGHACHTGQSCTAGACHGWGTVSPIGAPSARSQHTAVWTGTQMIVWGGTGATGELNTGARYNPATDTWTAMTTTGAPGARRGHAAVWTGSRMIVWSGYRVGPGWLADGGIYDPATDTWAALPGTSPAARSRFAYGYDDVNARFFVFGGWDATTVRGDGATFDGTNWTAVAPAMRPSPRRYLPAVWTGSRFIVWGGENAMGGDIGGGVPTNVLQDGSRYDAATDTWAAMTNTARPAGRSHHVAVWTGTQMIVWGGYDAAEARLADGGRYTLSSNTWATMAAAPIVGRIGHTAVYTGTSMITWGGTDVTFLADGASYTPGTDTWATLPTIGAPSARTDHTAVWDGSEMIVWGGANAITDLADGAVYAP